MASRIGDREFKIRVAFFRQTHSGNVLGNAEHGPVDHSTALVDDAAQPHAPRLQQFDYLLGSGDARTHHLFVVAITEIDVAGRGVTLGQQMFHRLHLGGNLALGVQVPRPQM